MIKESRIFTKTLFIYSFIYIFPSFFRRQRQFLHFCNFFKLVLFIIPVPFFSTPNIEEIEKEEIAVIDQTCHTLRHQPHAYWKIVLFMSTHQEKEIQTYHERHLNIKYVPHQSSIAFNVVLKRYRRYCNQIACSHHKELKLMRYH